MMKSSCEGTVRDKVGNQHNVFPRPGRWDLGMVGWWIKESEGETYKWRQIKGGGLKSEKGWAGGRG